MLLLPVNCESQMKGKKPFMQSKQKKFWEEKSLSELTRSEWEAICDGCGLCCLTKLQDEETEEIVYTCVVCKYSNPNTGQCKDYQNRSTNVPTCVPLTLENIEEFDWLPDSCGYRMLFRGQSLPDWHPLNSGNVDSVRQAGIGLQAISVVVDRSGLDYEDYIIDKP